MDSWCATGKRVEVLMIEDGLGGSKYAGRVIEVKMGSALVEFEVSRFFHDSPLFCMLSSSPLA